MHVCEQYGPSVHCLSQARQKSWKQSIADVVVVIRVEMTVFKRPIDFDETNIDERSDGCKKLKVLI